MKINIVSTYTADVLRSDLKSYLNLFSDAEIHFFYNQFFQQTLIPKSEFSSNTQGLNVILFRLSDYFSGQETTKETLKKQEAIIQALSFLNDNMNVPLLFIVTPSLGALDSDAEFFNAIEETLHKNILEYKNTMFLNSTALINDDISIFNSFTEKHGHIPYTIKFYRLLSEKIARTFSLLSRKPFKVIVIDCDGTLWNGIIEEQGLTGIEIDLYFQQVQQFLIDCYKKGFLLCLCSKNSEESVIEVLEHHPNMLIKNDIHLCTNRINWLTKSQNIKDIAQELNLGLDSFIFIDDNPAECAEVKAAIPEILAIELPKNTMQRLVYLQNIWAFDTLEQSKETHSRTRFYQTNRLRNNLKSQSSSYEDFLKNLMIKTVIIEATEQDYERIYELSLRTNQFNLNPQALTGVEINQAIKQRVPIVCKINVTDKFMDYGLVGTLIYIISTNILCVKSFFLSCRILSRGIEQTIVNYLLQIAEKHHIQSIEFELLVTSKNIPAINFLKQLSKQRDIQGKSIIIPIQLLKEYSPHTEPEDSTPYKKTKKTQINLLLHDYMLELASKHIIEKNKEVNTDESNSKTYYESIKTHLYALFLTHKIHIEQHDIPFVYFGLTSLQSVLIASEIYAAYQIEINPIDLIHNEITMDKLLSKLINKLQYTKITKPALSHEYKESILSKAQKRLWYDEKINETNSSRNTMFIGFEIQGQINEKALNRAIFSLIKKHDALRFSFINGDEPSIKIIEPDNFCFNIEYFSCKTENEKNNLISDFQHYYFDLTQAPLFRLAVINPNSSTPLLLFSIHHIIHDGWSLNILLKEISFYYELYTTSHIIDEIPEKILSYHYTDYILLEKNTLSEQKIHKNKQFWSKYLHKLPKLELVFDYPTKESTHCKRIPFKLTKATSKLLKKWAFTYHVTLYELLASAFALFLSQLCNQEDVHFITAVSGRNQPQTSNTVGFFVNLLLLRLNLNLSLPFIELVKDQKKIISTVMSHQDMDFHEILNQAGESLSSKHSFFHQAGFIYQSYPIHPLKINTSVAQRINSDDDAQLLYDACNENRFGNFVCFMQEFNETLYGLFEYNDGLFSSQRISSCIDSFQTLLNDIAQNPLKPASKLSLLSERQKMLLLYKWNHDILPFEQEVNLVSRFLKIVNKYPHAIAIKNQNDALTYSELDKQSDYIAHQLINYRLKNEMPIGLYLEQGIEQIIAMLAVIKTGCCYLPIDTDIPHNRLNYIVNDSKISLIMADKHTQKKLKSLKLEQLTVLNTSDLLKNKKQDISPLPNINIRPNHLAYMMYTSGSTGVPKGVLIEHAGIIRLVESTNYIDIRPNDRIAQSSQFLFDASTFEIWGSLLNGASLVCLPQKTLLNSNALFSFLENENISILFLTTQLFHTYAHIAPELFSNKLRFLVVGGESLLTNAVDHVLKQKKYPQCIINGYGPTENTTFSTYYTIKKKKDLINPIPIGKPINGTKVYVLNKELNPVPIGAIGTLYLSGHGLSRAYLNQENLTKKRFIHLFNERLYDTGDLVIWQADGNLRFIGRADNQIKVNGYRIELNEIETHLTNHPLIEQAIVLNSHKGHHNHIVAYILLKNEGKLTEINLYHYLKQTLPHYMIPHSFYQLNYVPITKNGKVDKKQLEQLSLEPITYSEFEAPNTEIEKRLNTIYARILHKSVDQISINSEFFDLGGTSISALQLIHTINTELNINLTFSILYEKSCIKDLSQYVELATQKRSLQSASIITDKNVLKQIKKGSPNNPPLILIHPIGGTGFCYLDLIKLLPDDQPCYFIQDPSIEANRILFDDMRSMAIYYNNIILNYFNHTPFLLAGFSFGGMLSIEMAYQLGHLEKLILGIFALDTWVVSHLMNQEAKQALKQSILNQYNQIKENLIKEQINPEPWMELYYKRLQDLGFNYTPPKINTKIILFKAQKLEGEFAAMCDSSNYLQLHSTQTVEVHHIEGSHNTILQAPNVQNIASILSCHPILEVKNEYY